ncbi:Coadhesin [Diplonema papillatum]|nr:Coadhesin [Diplonema papillatum]
MPRAQAQVLSCLLGVAAAADLTGWSLHRVSDGAGVSSDAAVCGGLLAVGEGPKDRVAFYSHDSVLGFPACGGFEPEAPAWNQRYGQQVQCIEATGHTAWIAVLAANVTEVLQVDWAGTPVACSAVTVARVALEREMGLMQVWRRGDGGFMLSHGDVARSGIAVSKLSRGPGGAWAVDTSVAFFANVTANSVDATYDSSRDMLLVVDPARGVFSRHTLANTALHSAGRVESCGDLAGVVGPGQSVSCSGRVSACFAEDDVLVAEGGGGGGGATAAGWVEVASGSSGTAAQRAEVRASFSGAHGVAPKLACPASGAALEEGRLVAVYGGEVLALVEPQHGGWCPFEAASPCDNACGAGSQDWRRTCACPVPRYGGAPCGGPAEKAEPCESYTHEWQASEFGACSSACGSGVACRSVWCDRCDGVPSSLCDASLEPAPCRECKALPSSWSTTPFGTCSATLCMEVGKATRTVTCDACTPEDGESYPAEDFDPCDFGARPADTEPCQFVSHNWKVLPNCERLSTGGVRADGCLDGLRQTICINCVGAPVDDGECTDTRPTVACIIPVYTEGIRPWTACDTTCGVGSIYRVAFCYKKCDASKKEVNAGLCPGELTDTREASCSAYAGGKQWSAWGPCAFSEGTCGDGTQTRRCQYKCNYEATTGCPGDATRACRVTCPKKKSSCHPAASVVVTPRGAVSVEDLRTGDWVLTCGAPDAAALTGRPSTCYYTRVYGFHHREAAASYEYVEVRYSSDDCAGEGVLRLSKDHLLAVNGVFTQAQYAKVGDTVVTSCAAAGGAAHRRASAAVTGVETREARGQYAFGTGSGGAIVDGVLASNYAGDLPQWRFELLFLPLRALAAAAAGAQPAPDADGFHWYVVGLCSLGGRTDLSAGTFSYWSTGAVAAILVLFFVVLPRALAAVVVGAVGVGKARAGFWSDAVHLGFLVVCCVACGAADEVPAGQVLLAAGIVLWFARSVQGALACAAAAGSRRPPAATVLHALCGTAVGWAWMRGDGGLASIAALAAPHAAVAAFFGGALFGLLPKILRNPRPRNSVFWGKSCNFSDDACGLLHEPLARGRKTGFFPKGAKLEGPVAALLVCSAIWQVAAGDVGGILRTETDHVVQFTAQSTVHMPCKGRQSHATGCTESASGHRVGNMRFSHVAAAGGEFCYGVDLLMFAEHQDGVTPFLTVHPDVEEWNEVPLTVCRGAGGTGGASGLRFYVPRDAKLTERTKEKIRFLQPFDLLIAHGEGGVCETWVPAASERRQKHDGDHSATLDHAITAEFDGHLLKQVSVDTSVTRSDDYISAETTAHATVLHEAPHQQRGAHALDVKEQQEVHLHSETEREAPRRAAGRWLAEFEGFCADAEATVLEVSKMGQEHPAEAAEVLRSLLAAPYEPSERVRFLFVAGFMAEKATADLVSWCVGNEFCTRGLQMEDAGRVLSSAAMSWQNRWGTPQPGYSKAAMTLLTTERADDYSVGDLTYTALQHAETAQHHDDAATKLLARMGWDHAWRATTAHNMKMTPATRVALHALVDDTCSSIADLHTCTPYLRALRKDPADVETRDKLIEVASTHPHTTARLRAVEVLMDRADVSCGHMQYLLDTEESEHIRAAISTIKPAGGRCLRVLFFDKSYGFPVRDRTRTLGGSFANVRMDSSLGAEIKFKGSAKWADLSFEFGAEAVAKADVVVSVLGGLVEATVFEGTLHFKAEVSAGFDFKQVADKALGNVKGVVGLSHDESPTKRRSAEPLARRAMTPLNDKPSPIVPYIPLPPVATASAEKMQAFCDRLRALNFPFHAERPFVTPGCTADAAKHPWSLFRYMYDREEGPRPNDAAIGEAVFSEDAERWVEWTSSHTTRCLTILRGLTQFERFGAASTFSYMSDVRMCAFTKALGISAAIVTGITHGPGFLAYYPKGHKYEGEPVHKSHKFGKDIDIAIPDSLQWKSGAAKPSDETIKKMAKACAALASGGDVLQVIVGPKAYTEAIQAVDKANSCGQKIAYDKGHTNHFHVTLADSVVPAPPVVEPAPMEWVLKLDFLGFGREVDGDVEVLPVPYRPLQLFEAVHSPYEPNPDKQDGAYAPHSNVEKLLFEAHPVWWQQTPDPPCAEFKTPGASWTTSATTEYVDRTLSACVLRDVLQVPAVEVEFSDKAGQTGAGYQRNGRSVAVTVPCTAASSPLDEACSTQTAEVAGQMYEEGTVEQILVPPAYVEVVKEKLEAADPQAAARVAPAAENHVAVVLKPPRETLWNKLMAAVDTTFACNISKNEFYLEFAGNVIRDQKLVDITCAQFGIFDKDDEKDDGRTAVALSDNLYEREWKLFQVEQCIPVMFFCLRLYASASVSVGVGWSKEIDLGERTVSVGLLPYAKAHLTVGGAVDLFLAKAAIELTATIADITVPLNLNLRALDFPVDVCMDGVLEIRPLAIKISFVVSIRDKFKIGWFYIKWTWGSKWQFVLYQWSAPPIVIPLFTTCKGTSEVSEPTPGRVAASQDGPYASTLDTGIAYSKANALGATESVSVGSIAGAGGGVTRALAGATAGRVKGDFAGVDGETYQVSLTTCTAVTRDRHCSDTVVQTLVFDAAAPTVSVAWFGLDVQASTGLALVTYPKMLCFDANYTDTSYLSEYAIVVKNAGNGSVIHRGEGRFYVNPCMRDLPLENGQVYTLSVSVADAVYHRTTVEASFVADLTPVVLEAIATTCEGVPGLQWAADRFCGSAAVFSRPLTAVRYEWSVFTSAGTSFSGVADENATHVSFDRRLNTTEAAARGSEFTVVLYAIYGNRIEKFQGPPARIAEDPVVTVTAQPCQHANQDICFEVESSPEIFAVHGRVGDGPEVQLGPAGCLAHPQADPGDVPVAAWGCNVFGKCSPAAELSVAMRNGVPECSVARSAEYVVTPGSVCFDFNASSGLGCGLSRLTAFLELVGRRATVDPNTSPAVNRTEENVGKAATMHCFATPLQDLSVYRVGLVAVDANGERATCSVAALTDLSPPVPSLLVESQFQLPTGTVSFTVVPPERMDGDPDTEASLALEVRLFSVSGWSSNDTFDWSERSTVEYGAAAVPYTIETGGRTGRFVIAAVAQDLAGNALRVVTQVIVDSTPPAIGTVKIGSAAAHRSKLPTNAPLVVDFGLGECGQSPDVVDELVSVAGPHGLLVYPDRLLAGVMDTCKGGASVYCNGRDPFGSQTDCVEMACTAGGSVLTAQANSRTPGNVTEPAATVCRHGVHGLYTSQQTLSPHCSPLYDSMPCREVAFQVAGYPVTRTVGGCVKRVPLGEFFAGPATACHTTTLGDKHPVLQSDTNVMRFAGGSFLVSPTGGGERGIGVDGLTLSDEGCRAHGTCHVEYPQSVKFFCVPDSLPRRDESLCGEVGDGESGMTCNVTLVDGGSGAVLEVLRSPNNEQSVTSAAAYASETVVTAEVECANAVGMRVHGVSAHTLILDPPPGRMESLGGLFLTTQGVSIAVEFADATAISVCVGAWEGDCMYAAKAAPAGGVAAFAGPFPVESFLFVTAFVETTRGLSFEHSIDPIMIDPTPPDTGVFEVDCGCGEDCAYVVEDAVGEMKCLLTWTGFDDVLVRIDVTLAGAVLASGMPAAGSLEFSLEKDGGEFLIALSGDNAAPAAGRKLETAARSAAAGGPLTFALAAVNVAGLTTTAAVEKHPHGCSPEPEVSLTAAAAAAGGNATRSGAVGSLAVLAVGGGGAVCLEAVFPLGGVCHAAVLFEDPTTGESLFAAGDAPLAPDGGRAQVCGLEAVLPLNRPVSARVVATRCRGCSAAAAAAVFLDGAAPVVVFGGGPVDTVDSQFCVDPSVASDATLAKLTVAASSLTGAPSAASRSTTSFDAPVCVPLTPGAHEVCVSAADGGGRLTEKCRAVRSDGRAPRVTEKVSLGCARKAGVTVPGEGGAPAQVWWEPRDWVCVTAGAFESFVGVSVALELVDEESGRIVAATAAGVSDEIRYELTPGATYAIHAVAIDVFGRQASSTTKPFVARPEDADIPPVDLSPARGEASLGGSLHWKASLCVRPPLPPSPPARCVLAAWHALELPQNIAAAFDAAVTRRAERAVFFSGGALELCLTAAQAASIAGFDEPNPTVFFVRAQCWDRFDRPSAASEGNTVLDRMPPAAAVRPVETVSSAAGGVQVRYGAQDDHLASVTVVIWRLEGEPAARGRAVASAAAENPVNSADSAVFVPAAVLPEGRYLAVVTAADAAGNAFEAETAFWAVDPATTTTVTLETDDASAPGSAPLVTLHRPGFVLSTFAAAGNAFEAETAFRAGDPATTTTVTRETDGAPAPGSAPLATLHRPAAAPSLRAGIVLNTFAAEGAEAAAATYLPKPLRVFKIRLNDSLPITRVEMCLSTQGSACDLKGMGPVPAVSGTYQYPVHAFEAGGDGRVFFVTLRYCLAVCDTADVGPFVFETTPPVVSGELALPAFLAAGQSVFVDWTDHFADPDTELEFSVCLAADPGAACFEEISAWRPHAGGENLTFAFPGGFDGETVAVCVAARNKGGHTARQCRAVAAADERPAVAARFGAENASAEGVLAQFGVTVSWSVGTAAGIPLKKCKVRLAGGGPARTSPNATGPGQVLPAEEFPNGDGHFNMTRYEGGWVDVGQSFLWVFAYEPAAGEQLVAGVCCTLENEREECVQREATAVVAESWEDAYYMGAIDLTPPECTRDALSQLEGVKRGPGGGYYFNGTTIGLSARGCSDRESNVTYTFCVHPAGGPPGGNCTEAYDLADGEAATLKKAFSDGERVGVRVVAAQPWGRSATVREHVIEQNLGVPVIQLSGLPSAGARASGVVGSRNACFPLRVFDANGIAAFSCSDASMLLSVCNQSHLCLNTSSPRSGFVELLAHDTFGFASSAIVEVVVEEKAPKPATALYVLLAAAAVLAVALALGALWLLGRKSAEKEELRNKEAPDEMEDAGGKAWQKGCDEPVSDMLV